MEIKEAEQAFQVETLIFEGPMDLLLHLIQSAELEITALAIAQVTKQFLSYIHELKEVAAEEVSAFLVVASRLVLIKSEALLPRPPEREPGEEDPAEWLLQFLLSSLRNTRAKL
jgi:segregation and condensation protein A